MNENIAELTLGQRIQWVDTSKAILIWIIYYVHIQEGFVYKEAFGINGNFDHGIKILNFLVFFAVPMFFFISGFVTKEIKTTFRIYCIKKFSSLMIPMYIFNLFSFVLIVVVRVFYDGLLLEDLRKFPLSKIEQMLVMFTNGVPAFNFPTWFLTCLFTTSILYFFVNKFAKTKRRVILSILFFSVLGYAMQPLSQSIPNFEYVIYIWFIPTSFTSLTFYLSGSLFREINFFGYIDKNFAVKMIILIISLVILFFLNDFFPVRNDPQFHEYRGGPYMNHLVFGNYFVFYIGAFAGIIASSCIAMSIRPNMLMNYVGQNTLALLFFVGIFYQFVDPSFAFIVVKYFSNISFMSFLLISAFFAILQVGMSLPFVQKISKSVDFIKNLFYNRFDFK